MDRRNKEDLLLAWHLKSATDEERQWVEAELLRDPEFRARSDRIREILRPLDHWSIPTPPAGLPERILARIESSRGQTQHWQSTQTPDAPATTGERARILRFPAMREWVAVAACITILVGIVVPAISLTRDRAREALCAANLGSVFQGLALYRSAFDGALPYAGGGAATAWLPAGPQDAPYASNSRHAFLLAKLNFGPTTEDFVCPSRGSDFPMPRSEVADRGDFTSARNISYATLGLSGRNPMLRPAAQVIYASDVNPLFVGGRFNAGIDPQSNSPAHRGRGQNVLALDGSVEHRSTPEYGPRNDNIWLAGNLRRYRGVEAPADESDSFLIQGFPITDLTDSDQRSR
ncbi:MAG: hypothetical protein J5J06_05315 [Phycisphaerae bacterium]|nr:hypothetical protein [Phycisphaerae bacterium]